VTQPGTEVQCVVLAGGLGTRMYPLTHHVPKALLPVHGVPFAHYQLDWMRRHGVTDVLYCIGHFGDQIREAIGDGSRFQLRVEYCDEGPHQLGTGGAVRLAFERESLRPSFLLTYADSFLRIDFGNVLRRFIEQREEACMVVYRNEGLWDKSNACVRDGKVSLYDKRPGPGVSFTHIDYGLAALRREIVSELPDGPSDLADLYHRLSVEGRLAALDAQHRFFEIGSTTGMADFAEWLSGQSSASCPG
jgi:NDP-sugar pyrophosphorylase family protein